MTVKPHPSMAEPVVAGLRSTAAGSRVCATCGKNVDVVAQTWSHTRAPRQPHRIEVVMSRAQWDKWLR